MKKITLSHYSLPDKKNTFTKNRKYSVFFAFDGGHFFFDTQAECLEFLAKASKELTNMLFRLNESYMRSLNAWRLLWFYSEENLKASEDSFQASNLVGSIDRMLERSTHWIGHNEFYIFRDLYLVVNELTTLWSILEEAAAMRNQWADRHRYRLEGQSMHELKQRLDKIAYTPEALEEKEKTPGTNHKMPGEKPYSYEKQSKIPELR